MQQTTIQHKQTSKSWVNAESLLKIDGTVGKKIHIPNNTNLNFNPYADQSISMVITRPSVSGTNRVFLSKRDSGSVFALGYGFYFHSNDTQIGFECYNGSDAISGFLTIGATIGNLFHAVITYTASTRVMNLYCNGVLTGTTTLSTPSGSYASTSVVKIGTYTNSGGADTLHYTGNVAFLSWYNKALSQVEVSQLYDQIGIVPKSLHANCVGYWTMQERYGNKAYDSVEQFNYAKGTALTANHADLIGYTDTEAGITDKTTQTFKADFYTKITADFWNASGDEERTGLPELKNCLLLDATHTISFPLSGTIVKTFKGYTYQAYRLKTGESLTPKEEIELDNNGLFANPSSAIRRKLDAYYQFNSIDTTSGNRIMDLIGTNHSTLTGSGFTIVTINSLR